jgi:hypothetical protein
VPAHRIQTWLGAAVFFLALIVAAENGTRIKHLSRSAMDNNHLDKQSSDPGQSSQVLGPARDDSDFHTRCHSSGVVKCVGFDSVADITGIWGDPSGILPGGSAPVIDPSVKASGNASLKFIIPPKSGPGSSGAYFTNFSNDLSVQFDSGQEFYVQWRQRFSPEFITNEYAGGGGWKQAIITEGDRRGFVAPSCQDIGVIVENTYGRKFPRVYHSCGVKDGQYEPLYEPFGSPPTDFFLQNGVRKPGCFYTLLTSGSTYIPPCIGYKPNQWMTFQVHIKVGTWYSNNRVYKHDSTIQLWVAEEGKPSVIVIDFSPHDPACAAQHESIPSCQTGYDLVRVNTPLAKYGKVWLLPYNTGKIATISYPEAYTWYDELIISRQRIPDAR